VKGIKYEKKYERRKKGKARGERGKSGMNKIEERKR